jgi:hypothetical protein
VLPIIFVFCSGVTGRGKAHFSYSFTFEVNHFFEKFLSFVALHREIKQEMLLKSECQNTIRFKNTAVRAALF